MDKYSTFSTTVQIETGLDRGSGGYDDSDWAWFKPARTYHRRELLCSIENNSREQSTEDKQKSNDDDKIDKHYKNGQFCDIECSEELGHCEIHDNVPVAKRNRNNDTFSSVGSDCGSTGSK